MKRARARCNYCFGSFGSFIVPDPTGIGALLEGALEGSRAALPRRVVENRSQSRCGLLSHIAIAI